MNTKNKPNTDRSYGELVERFVKWAETCADIRAAIIIGSRARADHPADEWADLDVVVVTTEPERYLSTTDWLGNIGNPLLTFVEPTAAGGQMEHRVLFEDMLDVDFAIIPERNLQQALQSGQVQISNAFGRGMRVLLDKDGLAAQLRALIPSVKTPAPLLPTQNDFLQLTNDFLYHAVFTTKHLRRGELWWAKMCSDCYMQHLLLRMIEWHAHAVHGWNYDTWFRGRFLEEWADPRVLRGLRGAFAHYDKGDVSRALLTLMDLFRWVAVETAEELGYPYPSEADRRVTDWVKARLTENGE